MKSGKAFRFFYFLVLAAFIVSGTALAVRSAELRRGDAFYAQAEETEERTPLSSAGRPPASPAIQPAAPQDRGTGAAAPEKPELSLRLAQFAEEYPDAVLWLQIPDTALDYPVMLGADNQFYLDHLPDKTGNALGSLFLDYRTGEDSVHLIVYGHNGAGGKMFGLLKEYESQDYFLEHRTLTAATQDCGYTCPIFSVRRVEADSGAYRLEFEEDGLQSYIEQAAAESIYPTDADLKDAAGVLTLSTCTGWRRSQRLIVQALLR